MRQEKEELLDSCESGWTYSEVDGADVISSSQGATDWYSEGSGSLKIYPTAEFSMTSGDYGLFEKDFDLTEITKIRVGVKSAGDGYIEGPGYNYQQILVAGNVEWEDDPYYAYEITVEIDTSAYSGVNTIGFLEGDDPATGTTGVGECWWDNLRSVVLALLDCKRILTPKR